MQTTTGQGLQNLSSNQAVRLLCFVKGADMNTVGDTPMPIINSSQYAVSIVLWTVSISLTTAHGSIYTLPAAGGDAIVADVALSAIDSNTETLFPSVADTDLKTAQTLYMRCGTAQGAAATLNCYVYGYDVS